MSAVVVGLNAARRVAGVDVECVQMRAYCLDESEVLSQRRARLEDCVLGAFLGALGAMDELWFMVVV